MSGGVDSAVAALLLHRRGFDVVGITMRLWSAGMDGIPDHQGCCSIEDIEDARRVCQAIGVPHYVLNLQKEFRRYVVDYFIAEYRRGRTPHPCLACNDRIKFDYLLHRARAIGVKYVATGHYARIVEDPITGSFRLLRGVETSKDQSYVLFTLTQAQLRHLLLPIGHYSKDEVRRVAREGGLHLADKRDSQDICFIPSGNYRQFMRTQATPEPGELVRSSGVVLGTHPGVENFTVGQRHGLGIATGERLFVIRVEASTRRVVVGPEDELYHPAVRVDAPNYIGGTPLRGPLAVSTKLRYSAEPVGATLESADTVSAVLRFDQPQRAVTPGQAAVFYEGDNLLGGGLISGPVAG